MFMQVMQGRVADEQGLRRQFDRWHAELAEGATGWLGSTAGVAADGRFVATARFEDEAAARANSDRPEQGAWWTDTEAFLDGATTFHDCTDVEVMSLHGDFDQAGFVQVMETTVTDRKRLKELTDEAVKMLPKMRPDLMGSVDGWYDGNRLVSLAYFTSESEAREKESGEIPEEAQSSMEEWGKVMGDVTYTDLTDPWLASPG